MSDQKPVVAAEGWHVLHLFYRIEYGQWQLLTAEERRAGKTALAELVQEIRATPDTQLLTFSVVTPKADLGFMLMTPDLQNANAFEKRLTLALGPDILTPVYSFLSMTERSEYTMTEEEYIAQLIAENHPEPAKAIAEFQGRMSKYLKDRVTPALPPWPVLCFYPMTKRRTEGANWYSLPFEERKKLMSGHARVGRMWSGKIIQLITGATGLDDAEWGVTLFAHDPYDIKAIVYQMRFDEVSARYSDFGEFYIGLQAPLDALFARVQI
jgi:peroxiredoxin